MLFRGPVTYLHAHWRGAHSLVWSVVVNLIALRALVLLIQEVLRPASETDFSAYALLVIGLAVVFHGLLFFWQVVGVVRACDQHLRDGYSMPGVWGAQLAAIVAFWLTATAMLECWQMTLPLPPVDDYITRVASERADKYELTVMPNGQTLLLNGSIELGITGALRSVLEQSHGIREIELTSAGGNIYEARGLAQLIREHSLDTRVTDQCTSACTTVFIGGHQRSVSKSARLGYHQYRVDAGYDVPLANPAAEQVRDRSLHAQAGVQAWFLDAMFSQEAAGMWFPSHAELRQAGVVTRITP